MSYGYDPITGDLNFSTIYESLMNYFKPNEDTVSRMDMLPYEVVYKIMLSVPFKDIVSYCKISTLNKMLCDDPLFWMDKLDQDFSYVNGGGYTVKASDYVMQYQHPDQRPIDIYRRWSEHTEQIVQHTDIKYMYNDIIIWLLEKNIFDSFDRSIERTEQDFSVVYAIAHNALQYNNIELVNWLAQRGIDRRPDPALDLDVLQWLNR